MYHLVKQVAVPRDSENDSDLRFPQNEENFRINGKLFASQKGIYCKKIFCARKQCLV